MTGDLEAGAAWVVTEGREHGDVGLFTSGGQVREEEAERLATLVAKKVGLSRVVFEAPRKDQQAWLITRLGADVGLGNVPPAEVLALEALRRGLRGDTIHLLTRRCADGGQDRREGAARR